MNFMVITLLAFLLVLSILVLIHELGHFLVAKKLGIKVEEFGFGFPLTPSIFSKKIGETKYSLYPVLIGGFVKLYGEDEAGGGRLEVPNSKMQDTKKDVTRAFFARPIWQRASVVVAGVVMNFLLAVVIISYLFSAVGVSVPGKEVIIADIAKDSPAQKAALPIGGVIVSVDGHAITSADQVISYTNAHLGQELHLVIKTPKQGTKTYTITPRKNHPANQGAMGVAIAQNSVRKIYPWYQAPIQGTIESLKFSWLILVGLVTVVVQLVTGAGVPQGVAGPIGIAQLTGQSIKMGFDAYINFIALLSLNLAIFNILPIPALDGGRFFFIIIEALTGKKVNPKIEGYAHAAGMVFLLGLMALVTFYDIFRWLNHLPILPK